MSGWIKAAVQKTFGVKTAYSAPLFSFINGKEAPFGGDGIVRNSICSEERRQTKNQPLHVVNLVRGDVVGQWLIRYGASRSCGTW